MRNSMTPGVWNCFRSLKMNSIDLEMFQRSQTILRRSKLRQIDTIMVSWSFLIFLKISKGQTIPIGTVKIGQKRAFARSNWFSLSNTPFYIIFISFILLLTYMEENRYFLVYLIFTPFFLSWSWISSLFGGVKLRFRIGSYLLNSNLTLTPPPFFIKSP